MNPLPVTTYALRKLATGELFVATGSISRDRFATREEAAHAARVLFGIRARAYEIVALPASDETVAR